MRFTARVKENGQVTVPADIRDCYEIQLSDYVEFEVIKVKKK